MAFSNPAFFPSISLRRPILQIENTPRLASYKLTTEMSLQAPLARARKNEKGCNIKSEGISAGCACVLDGVCCAPLRARLAGSGASCGGGCVCVLKLTRACLRASRGSAVSPTMLALWAKNVLGCVPARVSARCVLLLAPD